MKKDDVPILNVNLKAGNKPSDSPTQKSVMKKVSRLLTLSLPALFLQIFSPEVNEKPHDSFWTFLENNYPFYNAASSISSDASSIQ